MDKLLNMLGSVVIDVQGLDEDQFCEIFSAADVPTLTHLFNACNRNPNKFISKLSSEHKRSLTKWAVERTFVNTQVFISTLISIIRYMKGIASPSKQIKPGFTSQLVKRK